MQPARLAARRTHPLRRPLRPPSALHPLPKPRPFTHNSQLLLVISPSGPRPQLPFLHPSSNGLRYRQHGGQWQLARLLTTERKKYIKEQVWLAGKWTIALWTSVGLLFVAAFGVQNELLERKTPSPHEWSVISRMNYRSARAQENPEFWPSGITDWASTGCMYRDIMDRLEDPNIDGQGLKEQDDGGILVPGVGKAGYDITEKSEAWRRGYHEVLMGCAKAAEHLDGWVKDTTRRISFPPDVVIGPSNPNPRPCPPYAHEAPLEENCVPAFEGPETYYIKVLTTKGFDTRQRLDAALGYADWLDYKELPDSAREMYTWALDIATAALPDASSVVDVKTGVLRENAAPTANLVRTATAYATHLGRSGDAAKALPIYLSVLRARRAAPVSPSTSATRNPTSTTPADSSIFATLISLLGPPPYPPPPPSGDEPLTRVPGSAAVDEAALKTYVGEILFALGDASSRSTGLEWTRDAVRDAEEAVGGDNAREEKARAAQCLEVALGNLEKMVGRLAREEKEGSGKGGSSGGWFSFWRSSGNGVEVVEGEEEGSWAREEREVREKIVRMHQQNLREKFSNAGKVVGGVWIG